MGSTVRSEAHILIWKVYSAAGNISSSICAQWYEFGSKDCIVPIKNDLHSANAVLTLKEKACQCSLALFFSNIEIENYWENQAVDYVENWISKKYLNLNFELVSFEPNHKSNLILNFKLWAWPEPEFFRIIRLWTWRIWKFRVQVRCRSNPKLIIQVKVKLRPSWKIQVKFKLHH